MRHSFCVPILLVLATTGLCLGQTGIGGPVTGSIEDARTESIRPILGFPGGAVLGLPIQLSAPAGKIRISPAASCAIVVAQDTGAVLLVRWSSDGKSSTVALSGALGAPSDIIFSDSGASVLLVHQVGSAVQVVIGLPNHPQVRPVLELDDQLGLIQRAAIRNTGAEILLALSANQGSSDLYRVMMSGRETGMRIFVAHFTNVSAIHYVNSEQDAAVADAGANEIVLLQGVGATASVRHLAGASDGVAQPVALSTTADGKRLVIVNGGDSTALVLDMSSGALGSAISLSVSPTRCDRLASGTAFVVNGTGDALLQIVDLGLAQPASFFVPIN